MFSSENIKVLKKDVLNFLNTLKVPNADCEYKFSVNSDSTIFSSIFALFILDLFKQTDNFSKNERNRWINYIQNFQNKETGIYEPKEYFHKDKERNSYQLTAFCISALKILNAKPNYKLKFVDSIFKTSKDVENYLINNKCHLGKGGSGNKAMFLAIFLQYQYELTSDIKYKNKINTWLNFHNKHQNKETGFWGNNYKDYYLKGLQNGFHQFIIYYYLNKEIPLIDKIVKRIIDFQNCDGSFSFNIGGQACKEYDVIHTLLIGLNKRDFDCEEIKIVMERVSRLIFKNKNIDGGFCSSKIIPSKIPFVHIIMNLKFFFYGKYPMMWYYRVKNYIGDIIKGRNLIHTGWTKYDRKIDESNLWDTWFRCLTILEISCFLSKDKNISNLFRFQDMIGIGYFNYDRT